MQIRLATLDDLPAIVDILNAAIVAGVTAETVPLTVEDRRFWFNAHNPERHPIWIAMDEDRVSGWLSLSRYYPKPAYDAAAEVSVYVAPELQRQGVARTMMRHAIEAAPNLGMRTLVAYVWAHNVASVKLFEASGFERWGRLPDIAVIDGVPVSTIILGLKL